MLTYQSDKRTTRPAVEQISVPREALRGHEREKRLVLLVTYACQLDCRYCCVLRSLRGRKDMSIEHMKKAVDFLLTSVHPNLQIHFFGAEPLLLPFGHYEAFFPYATRRAKEEGKHFTMMVTSNAALVKPEWVDMFREYNVALEVSLDGAPESHNRNRPTVSGRDSYSEIASNLPRIFASGIPVQDSMVISPQTAAHVVENFNHMVDWGFKRVFMMVANCVVWPKESLAALKEQLDELLEIYPRVMKSKKVRLLNLTDWVWPMRMNTELSVDSSGDIYSACVGYLARDPHLKARCSLAHIDTVQGTYDHFEKLRLNNVNAMGIVFGESSALHALPSSAMAGQIMTNFVAKLRARIMTEYGEPMRQGRLREVLNVPAEKPGERAVPMHSTARATGQKVRLEDPAHRAVAAEAMEAVRTLVASKPDAGFTIAFLSDLLDRISYPARAFEIALHSLMQALEDRAALPGSLRPMSAVRVGIRSRANLGDVEILKGGDVIEAWDARFGRTYLRDEVEDFAAKLPKHSKARLVGFVVDRGSMDRTSLKTEVLARSGEIEKKHNVALQMLDFENWAKTQIRKAGEGAESIAGGWLIAFAESLLLLRRDRAPLEDASAAWAKEIRDFARKRKPKITVENPWQSEPPAGPVDITPLFLPPGQRKL